MSRAEIVYIVWEKSTAARPFFEACQHSAVRVWSIETQMDNLEDVADYVAKAWHFGGLAETASVAASYPMGSTSNQDAPGEVWNPCHADEEDSSVQVPYVIKWYAASDQLLHLMLGGRTSTAEQKPVDAFHLPMLLDQQEMRLSAPQQTSTLLVGRSGQGYSNPNTNPNPNPSPNPNPNLNPNPSPNPDPNANPNPTPNPQARSSTSSRRTRARSGRSSSSQVPG